MLLLLKRFIKSHTYLTALAYIVYNLRIHCRLTFGNINTHSGTTHADLNIKESVQYVTGVYNDYCAVAKKTTWQGRLAEIGPGDNDGVAALFLAHGAEKADLADRFFSIRDIQQQKTIYKALHQQYPHTPVMNEDGTIPGIQRFYGPNASAENFFQKNISYSTIISRSVLEHVDDPEHVLRSMYSALEPGGVLVHKVDLRDHGMMTPYTHDLKWMEIPAWLYTLMVKGSGYPNRFLFHDYKRVLLDLNPNCQFYVAGLNGTKALTTFYQTNNIPADLQAQAHAHIEKYRPRLAKPLRQVDANDLMVSSFFFVCEKPRDTYVD